MGEVPKESGIYAIRRKENGKAYVGSARSLASRWRGHQRLLEAKRHTSIKLQRAWNKYGPKAFEFVVLELCPLVELISAEQRWLDKFNSSKVGYNISPTAGSIFGTTRGIASKARSAIALTRLYSDPDVRRRQSEAIRAAWQRPEYRQAHMEAIRLRILKYPEQLRAARKKRRDYTKFGAYARKFVKSSRKKNQYRTWTVAEDQYLREYWESAGMNTCAQTLGRSTASVSVRANKLGLTSKGTPGFSERMRLASLARESKGDNAWRDKSVLRRLYVDEKLTLKEIGQRLGCSGGSVGKWVEAFEITRPESEKVL